MLKKAIIAFILLFCGVLIWGTFTFLKEEAFQSKHPIEAIPKNAAIVFESNNIKSAWSRIAETNLVYAAALNDPSFAWFDGLLHTIDSTLASTDQTAFILDNKPTVISLHAGDGIQYFVAGNASEEAFKALVALAEKYGTIKQITIEDCPTNQITVGEQNYFLSYAKPFVLFSTDAALIKQSIQQVKIKESLLSDPEFVNLRKTENSNIGFHIYINGKKTGSMLAPYLTKAVAELWQNGGILPSWTLLDLNEKSNAILINGLSTQDVSNPYFENAEQQTASASKSLWLLPTDLLSFRRTSISDPVRFIQSNSIANTEDIANVCNCDPEPSFADWISDELVSITFGTEISNDAAYLIGASGYPNLQGKLSGFGVSDTLFKNVYGSDIYLVKNKNFLNLLGINDTLQESLYFARMNDFAVISSYQGISKIAYQWKASQASVPNNSFINFSQKFMANYSTNDIYFTWIEAMDRLQEIVKPEYATRVSQMKTSLSQINGFIWQNSIAKEGKLYHSLALNTNQGNQQVGAVQELWKLSLQKNVLSDPQVMKNHQTGTNEVVLQDELFQLHLISATGKVKWTKLINEPIIGEISQIDLYNNGKYQMLFNTATKIHLLDINGNEVTGYPIKLPTNATNSVTVMDYDKNGEYRLLIATIDKKIHNYSKDGKPVTGWLPIQTGNIVVNKGAHFVIDSKDYICFYDISGAIYLANRKGEPREQISNKIHSLNKDAVFLQKGTTLQSTKFMYSDTSGRLVEMPLDGLEKSFVLDSTAHEFYQYAVDVDNDKLPEVLMSFGNKFSVFGPDKVIYFSEIFDFDITRHIRNLGSGQQYTLIADEKGQRIYLYNYQFKPVEDFPQVGTFKTVIGDLNKDGNQEVITVINGKEIITYSLNPLHGI